MILIESIFMMYIKNLFLIIFLVTLSNCISKNQFSYFADEPIYKNPDGEFEGFVIDYLYDNLVVYSYTLPIEEKKLHNKAIFSALSDENHGKIYEWQTNKYFGRVKVLISIYEGENICRSWMEEIGLIRGRNKLGISKACFNPKRGGWVYVDYLYHLKT